MRTSALLAPSGGHETSVRGPLDMQDAHCAAAATVVSCVHASAWCRNTRLQESVYLFVMVAGGRPARPKGGQGSGLTVRARFSPRW